MPTPDPIPGPRRSDRTRFVRALRLVVLFALAVAAASVLIVHSDAGTLRIHMLIATFLGIFLSIVMAGALMLLIFASSRSGHDEAAHHFTPEDQ